MGGQDRSIQRKVVYAIMLTSSAVLLFTCAGFVTYEMVTYRHTTIENLSTLAEITAENSTAAITYQNVEDALEVLSALRAEEDIVRAAFYDNKGALFASYPQDEALEAFPKVPKQDGAQWKRSQLTIFQPVLQAGVRKGTLYLQSDLGGMQNRLKLYTVIVLLVIVGSYLVAFGLSDSLQKRISQPILELARTARTVAQKNDFSVRAEKQSDDELGQLTDDFNQMLAQIQTRDQELRASEGRFRQLADSMPQIVWSARPDGSFDYFNKRWYELTGFSEEVTGDAAWKPLIHPDDASRCTAEWLRSVQSESPYQGEYRFKDRRVNTYRWYIARALPIRDVSGKIARWYGSWTDVDDLKRAENALRENEERLRAALDAGEIGAWDWDIARNQMTWSERLYEFHGLAPGTFGGRLEDFTKLIHPQDRDAVSLALRGALERKLPYQVEFRVVWSTGEIRWLTASGRVLEDEAGQSTRMVGATMDITERKQAEEEIYRLNAQLEQRVRERTAQLEASNRELEAFSYSVSHDLRAPLRGIDGFSQALLEDYNQKLDDQGREYLQRTRAASQRMARLIDDMLHLSRVTRSEMRLQNVDLSQLVDSLAAEVGKTEPHRNVRWIIPPGLSAYGDEPLLRIALQNLIANAWKFTGKREAATIEFGFLKRGEQTVFFIRDNGAGFDMAYEGKLFGAFQRLHSTHEFPGTGIGLATVQRIIHRHGGQIWAESHIGQGATFYFELGEGKGT